MTAFQVQMEQEAILTGQEHGIPVKRLQLVHYNVPLPCRCRPWRAWWGWHEDHGTQNMVGACLTASDGRSARLDAPADELYSRPYSRMFWIAWLILNLRRHP